MEELRGDIEDHHREHREHHEGIEEVVLRLMLAFHDTLPTGGCSQIKSPEAFDAIRAWMQPVQLLAWTSARIMGLHTTA
jgi:hypothetical protein